MFRRFYFILDLYRQTSEERLFPPLGQSKKIRYKQVCVRAGCVGTNRFRYVLLSFSLAFLLLPPCCSLPQSHFAFALAFKDIFICASNLWGKGKEDGCVWCLWQSWLLELRRQADETNHSCYLTAIVSCDPKVCSHCCKVCALPWGTEDSTRKVRSTRAFSATGSYANKEVCPFYDAECSEAPPHFSSKLAKSPSFHMVLPFVLLNIHGIRDCNRRPPTPWAPCEDIVPHKNMPVVYRCSTGSNREPAGDGHRHAPDTTFTFHYDDPLSPA